MSREIDERIVEMRFDNQQFERNVRTSMSTLDKLKEKLDFSGASKGLENLSTATSKFRMDGLTNAVETVHLKFSAFEVMAVTALANITNSAINAGKNLVKSLSVDNIVDGWKKFGDKTTSVATLVSQGYDLETVNKQLDRLNWFTDETSYNFTDMVANIAKFTASGKDLTESVTAMEGIANWAALSGQNANTASRAMYQLSQAMGSGVMRKEDYKSIQNASMDTEEFRKKALEAGVALGTLQKNADGTYRSLMATGKSIVDFNVNQFADHLTEDAWFTSDVMMKVFNDYSGAVDQIYEYAEEKGITASEAIEELGDKVDAFGLKAFRAAQEARSWSDVVDSVKDAVSTGWMNTFEIIFGNYEEAKAFWTDLANAMYDVFAGGAEKRNELLQGWKDAGGRNDLIDSFWNVWNGIADVIGKIKEGFRDIFPETTVNRLVSITTWLKSTTSKFGDLHKIFEKIDEDGVGFGKAFSVLYSAGDISNSFSVLKKLGNTLERIKSIARGFASALDIVRSFVMAVASGIKTLLGNFKGFGSVILDSAGSLGDWVTNLRNSIKENKTFEKAVDKVVAVIQKFIDGIRIITPHFSNFGGWLKKIAIGFKDWVSGLKNAINETGIFGGIIQNISKFLKTANQHVTDFLAAIHSKISDSTTFSGILGVLQAIGSVLKYIGSKAVSVLKTIGRAISNVFRNGDFKMGLDTLNSGIVAVILLNIKKFVSSIKDFTSAKDGLLSNITGILDSVKGCFEAWQQDIKAGTLLKIAGAIAILAGSLVIIAAIDPDKLTTSLGALASLFTELVVAMAALQKFASGSGSTSTGIDKLFESFAKDNTSKNMIAMSGAILILSFALKNLSQLSADQLAVGLTGITVLLGELVASMKILQSDTKKFIKGATQIVILVAALKILASACKDLSALSWNELAKGLFGVGGLLLELLAFMKLVGSSKISVSTATSIIILSAALKVLASVCSDLGGMDWGSIGKGIAGIGALLLELGIFAKLVGNTNSILSFGNEMIASNTKNMLSIGIGMIAIAAALKILVGALNNLSHMSWEEIAKGLTAMAGILLSIAASMKILPEDMIGKSVGFVVVAAAITILSKALASMGGMSWAEIAKGLISLGGSMLILALGLNAMNGTVGGAAALLVSTVALGALAKAIKTLGSMSLAEIGIGLLAIAGTLTVIGVAGALLAPIVPAILALGGAMLLFGAGCALVGAGVLALSVGLAGLSTSLVVVAESIVAIIISIVSGLGDIIVATCTAISNSAQAIAEALVSVVSAACYALKETAPQIAETALSLLVEGLTLLKNYIPQLVNLLVDVVGSLLDSLSLRVPELVDKVLNFIGIFMSSLNAALGDDGLKSLISSLESVALVFIALGITAKVISTIPISGALTGIASLAIVVGGIAGILAILGGLAQIPGFTWLIDEGSKVLGQIGTAIGEFVGNIVGGVMKGVTGALPDVGQNLSDFMINVQPFVEGLRLIDKSVLDGAVSLAGAVLAITAADVISGLTSWFTGGSSLTSFGEDLAAFGPKFKEYADSVAGIDANAVTASATAAQALSTLANGLPNEGGVISWFTGDNNIADFGKDLVTFGGYLTEYSNVVSDMKFGAVIASSIAGQSLSELANSLPSDDGIISKWFGGGTTNLDEFGKQLVVFGGAIADYSATVDGKVSLGAVLISTMAGQMLSNLAKSLPATDGVVAAWFTGGQLNLESFGNQLVIFGNSIAKYSATVSESGINLTAVLISTMAGQMLSSLAKSLPATDGAIAAWFTGGKLNLESFGKQLVVFGDSIAKYSETVDGKVSLGAVAISSIAGTMLSNLAKSLPATDGVVAAWFTGGKLNLKTFGEQLVVFGNAIASYSEAVSESGINLGAIMISTIAGSMISGLAKTLPSTDGVVAAWFTGGQLNLKTFGEQLVVFGTSIANYSKAVSESDIDTKAVSKSTQAGRIISSFAKSLPSTQGVISQWFSGGTMSLKTFGEQLAAFGSSIVNYSKAVSGTEIDEDAVKKSTSAGQMLATLAGSLPDTKGIVGWFTGGGNNLKSFGNTLGDFGKGIAAYAKEIAESDVDLDAIAKSTSAGAMLAELAKSLPESNGIIQWFTGGSNTLKTFGEQLTVFGLAIVGYSSAVSGGKISKYWIQHSVDAVNILAEIDADKLSKSTDSLGQLTSIAGSISTTDFSGFSSFANSLGNIGAESVDNFIKAFLNSYARVTNVSETFISKVKTGIANKKDEPVQVVVIMVSSLISALRGKYSDFYNAGSYLVTGFSNGISYNTYKASAQARAMANAAADAARKALDEHSPSKVGYGIGDFFGVAFVNGIRDNISKAYSASYAIGSQAQDGLSRAISRISDIIASGMDTEPVITPVVDLSNVSASSNTIANMLRMTPSIASIERVSAINSRMSHFQNGSDDDVVSAIKALGSKLGNHGDTYTINGITYDDGSNVADAVQTLVRAARVERRR